WRTRTGTWPSWRARRPSPGGPIPGHRPGLPHKWGRVGLRRLVLLRQQPGQRFRQRADQRVGLLLADQVTGDEPERGHESRLLRLESDHNVLSLMSIVRKLRI